MFVPMAQTVSFALLGALVLSLTYIPAMAALVLRVPPRFHLNVADKLVHAAWRVYLPALRFTLRRPLWVLGLSVVLLGASFWQFTRLGGVFIPRLEEGDFAVETRILTGSSLTQMIATTTEAERLLRANFPEVKAVVSKIGTSEIPTDPMFIESADIIIVLKDKHEWTSARTLDELAEKMQETLSQLPGVAWGFQMPIQMRFNELMTGGKTDVVLQLYGEDLDTLGHLAEQIAAVARTVEGAEDVVAERVEGLPQVVVQVRRDQLARYGLTVDEVNQAVRTAYAGTAVGAVYEKERRYELVLRMEPHLRTDPDAVGRIWVEGAMAQRIRLSEVATVELREGPLQVARNSGRRRTAIGLNVRNRDVQAVVQDLKAALSAQVRLPIGYSVTYGGQFENLEQATARMRYSILAVLLLILLLLYLTFLHLPQTLFIFLGVPFATVGGIWALALRDLPFSVSAAVGFITVFGVSVLNGMVLIGYLRELAQEGHSHLLRRLLTAVQVRLRPVLMTSLVASLGFLPMALSSGDGAEVQRPLATVVIGGLISNTLLTLLLLPLAYFLWEARERKRLQTKAIALKVIAALLLCSLPAVGRGQTTPPNPTLDQLVQAAETHSPYLRQAAQQTVVDRQAARATFRLPPTELLGSYGRINEPINDVLVNVQQRWAWPGLYVREAQAAKAQAERSEAQYRVLLRFERGAVKLLAYQWAVQQRRLVLLDRYDSLFRNLGQVARARAAAGTTSPVEPQSLESRALNWQTQRAEAQAQSARLLEALAFRTGMRVDAAAAWVPDLRRTFEGANATAGLPKPSPQLLQPAEMEVRRADLQWRVARNSLAPNFLLGYTWQTIRQVGGNHIGSVGLGIPLPLGGNLRQLKVARAQLDLARLEAETRNAELRLQLTQTLNVLQVLAPLLAEQWPQRSRRSEALVAAAQRGYLQGNLPLVDLLLHVEEAAQAELLLLDQLDRWNEAVLLYETLTQP
jgi:cobalt-zinc-cadmium resistance protein CzcA